MSQVIRVGSIVELPEEIRVSIGSAIVLGLTDGRLNAAPTTAYLMTYKEGKCLANCGFCPQSRESNGRSDMLSRVTWPAFPTRRVVTKTQNAFRNAAIKRVCIQALNYSNVFLHLQALVKTILQEVKVPISVSCQPLKNENIKLLADSGVERIGIPLDAATERLFEKIKGRSAGGPYNWRKQLDLLGKAVDVFGRGRVTTHLIVGLGETEQEMVETIQRCVDDGILPAIFAFTPIIGTALGKSGQPPLEAYRRIQVARSLITHGTVRYESMRFDERGRLIDFDVKGRGITELVETGEPFLTSGCPDCNRPYYNEKPSGPLFNYPRNLTLAETSEMRKQLSPDEA